MRATRCPTRLALALTLAALAALAALGAQAQPLTFRAHLSGAEEVPPVASAAQGQVTFRVAADGSSIHYRLNIANIENVTMSHIHAAPAGSNGPVVAWLYPAAPPPQLIDGRSDGVLAAGVITAANLVGPLAGQTLADLVARLASGDAYVNVHTAQVPSGEVRGQVR